MSEATPMQVLIVGAGLGGLATGIAMRAAGRKVTILEQSSMKSEVGAAIHLAPNATKIIKKWGLDIQKEAQGVVCRQVAEIGMDGAVHAKIPVDTEKAFGAPWLFQHRVDLHTALKNYAEQKDLPGEPVEIIGRAKVVKVDCEAGKVTTADGKEYTGDLVVGADGIHSEVRAAILGSKNIAQPSGHSAYRCLIPAEKVADVKEAQEVLSVDQAKMYIIVGGDRRVIMYPCRMATILNIVAVCPDSRMKIQSEQDWKVEGTTEDLVQVFEGFPSWLLDILGRAEKPGVWQLRDQEPLPSWVKGRAIVVGDAAHSMLPHQGQGCGQAIEDAEAIGAMFEGLTGSLDAQKVNSILMDVFNARIKRASLIQAYSRQQAMPVQGDGGVRLNAGQFAGYNMAYSGIKDWMKKEALPSPIEA